MGESPRGQGWTPSTETHQGPPRAAPKRAPYCGPRCFYTRLKVLCQSALGHTTAPVSGRL
eukprot:528994-Alexandrium_andersonii.AAC.1